MLTSTFFQKPCGANFSLGCNGCGGECDWACCPARPQPFEGSGSFRGVAVLRDPVHLIVSQHWYRYDRHEVHESRRFENGTEGMLYQLITLRLYKALSVSVEFVRRNSPAHVRMACLEDFMATEQGFYDLWEAALNFLGLPLSPSELHEHFADLNPLSPSASETTVAHSTFRNRTAESLKLAREALRLDRTLNLSTALFSSVADLSIKTNCWDWATNARGKKDAWQL